MTTIVTRLYATQTTAEQASEALKMQNHPASNISIVGAGKSAEADLVAAGVPESSASSYAGTMKAKNAVIVVRAPVTPFGAARNAMDTVDQFDSIDAGVENDNFYKSDNVHENLLIDLKVDRTHRYWGTWKFELEEFGEGKRYPRSGRKYWGSLFGTKPLDYAGKHWGSFLGHPLMGAGKYRSEEHTSELQSLTNLVCRLLLEKKKKKTKKQKQNKTMVQFNCPHTIYIPTLH